MPCILIRYRVIISDQLSLSVFATDRKDAFERALMSARAVDDSITRKRFRESPPEIIEDEVPDGYGREILVGGRTAHWLGDLGDMIQYTWPNSRDVLTTTAVVM